MSERTVPRSPVECDCDTCTFLDGRCSECKAGNHIRCANHGIAAIDGPVCDCEVCASCRKDSEDEAGAN